MSKPEVTLTLAGNAAPVLSTFDQVGAGSREMATEVGRSSRNMEDSTDRVASANSQLSGGIGDIGGALTQTFGDDSMIGKFGASMEGAAMVVMGFTGVMDLANLATRAHGVSAIWTSVQTKAAAIGTRAWAIAQGMLNVAFWVSPLGLIILGIIALIAVVVLIATKTTWFQTIWRVAWTWVKKTAVSVWEWLRDLPGKIGGAFRKIAGFIQAPFRAAFNFIADAWNNTVGRLSWSVPGWVPIIGGNSISVPRLPKFHGGAASAGGGMPAEFLAVLRSGESVSTRGPSGGALELRVSGVGTSVERSLAEAIAGLINRNALQLTTASGERVAVRNA
jgi:hypothetical protein